MKKTAIALLAALSFTAASAQYITTTEVGVANGWAGFNADGVDRMAYNDYQNAVTIYNDDFSVNRTFTVSYENAQPVPVGNYVATQRLFNNDDLYEFVIQNQDLTFSVVNENGENLGSIPATNLMTIGNQNYIYKYDDESSVYTFYAIAPASGSLINVSKAKELRVFPNPANPGETIRFQMEDGTIADVDLYNAAGVRELRATGGEGTVELPADRLSPGVHPYNVTDAEGTVRTGKLIVK